MSNLFKKCSEGIWISAVVAIQIWCCIPHWLIGKHYWISHSPPFVFLILSCSFFEFCAPSSWMSDVYIFLHQLMWDDDICHSLGWLLGLDFCRLATRSSGWALPIFTFFLVGSWRKIPFLGSHCVRNFPFGCQLCWYKTTQLFQAKLGRW